MSCPGRRRAWRLALVGSVLMLSGVAVAPGASAAVPAASKTCRSLNTLNKNLDKALASGTSGHVALRASANAVAASTARRTASTVDTDWPGNRRSGLSVSNGAASTRTTTPNEATTAPRERTAVVLT